MNRDAFASEYSLHKHRLVNRLISKTGNRDTAEDIASAAFATAFRKLSTFRGDSSLSTWVHAIAMNELKTQTRRKPTVPLELVETLELQKLMEQDSSGRIQDRVDCIGRIRKVLRRVPKLQRRMLTDHFIMGRSIAQIAARYRIPKGTVLSRIFNGKRKLRQAWEACWIV